MVTLTSGPGSSSSCIRPTSGLVIDTYDWIVYSRVECASNWNQFCSGGFKLEAPAEWQVCNPLFTVEVQKNDGNYYVVPKDWYLNDPEKPNRFRSYVFTVETRGSGKFYDQWGSKIRLANVGLRLIGAGATNKDRIDNHCNMPRQT